MTPDVRVSERVTLFSNGSEWMSWAHYNCDHCTRQRPCELEDAIALAYLGDGKADESVAQRLGLLSDGYDVRCSERIPTPALAAFDKRKAAQPQWRIRRGDGFTPVDGIRWSPQEARQAIANWNRYTSYDPKYQYTITRFPVPEEGGR